MRLREPVSPTWGICVARTIWDRSVPGAGFVLPIGDREAPGASFRRFPFSCFSTLLASFPS